MYHYDMVCFRLLFIYITTCVSLPTPRKLKVPLMAHYAKVTYPTYARHTVEKNASVRRQKQKVHRMQWPKKAKTIPSRGRHLRCQFRLYGVCQSWSIVAA